MFLMQLMHAKTLDDYSEDKTFGYEKLTDPKATKKKLKKIT